MPRVWVIVGSIPAGCLALVIFSNFFTRVALRKFLKAPPTVLRMAYYRMARGAGTSISAYYIKALVESSISSVLLGPSARCTQWFKNSDNSTCTDITMSTSFTVLIIDIYKSFRFTYVA